MKRILLVGCDYFPLSTPGAFRLYAFAKYLPEFGYEPHILTIDWNETNAASGHWSADCLDRGSTGDICPVTRFYYKFPPRGVIRGLLRQYTTRGLFPISWPLPLTRLIFDNMELLQKQKTFDMILTTVPYYPPMKAGHRMHVKNGLPWVIDFRDIKHKWPIRGLWTKPWRWPYPAYEKWGMFCQGRLAREANAVVAVSEPLAEALEGQKIAKVRVVHSGFAPEEFPVGRPQLGDKFQIVYAGSFFPEQQSPVPLLDALDILCQSGEISERHFSLDFYGVKEERIRILTASRRCAELVHVYTRLQKRAIHEVMAAAGVLLHLSVEGAKGMVTSKLTEYLGARRPILTIPGDHDVVDQLLARTGAGVSMRNPAEIGEWVLKQYEHWKSRGEYGVPNIVEEEVEKYTWHTQVRKLAELLDDVYDSHVTCAQVKRPNVTSLP